MHMKFNQWIAQNRKWSQPTIADSLVANISDWC